MKKIHTKEAIKQRGEIFTPPFLVKQMLDKLPPELFEDKDTTFLDNSCGDGAFLVEVMSRKRKHMSHFDAIRGIFGVELDENNCNDCRNRLIDGSQNVELINKVIKNIQVGDALTFDYDKFE